jgi:hypothetical protein
MKYNIHEITGQYAISPNKGQKLYDLISPLLLSGQVIEIDFSGVKIFATAFFNVATGQLLQDFSRDDLNRQIRITGLNDDGQHILQRVMDNAEHYYTDAGYQRAVDNVMQEYVANC